MNALCQPHAFARTRVSGVMRTMAADFRVDEVLAFEPTGTGEHLLLHIEKQGENTEAVAHHLARAFDVPRVAVSFAGRKDRHAVTAQWFSVHTPKNEVPAMPERCRLVQHTRHIRKLRRGEIASNQFQIRLRALEGDLEAFDARLAALAQTGVPNYFGEQRFGREGANVPRARSYLIDARRQRVSAFDKGLHISVARALVFNAVLAHRVEQGNWNSLVAGDLAIDGAPTGPLWGRGRCQTSECAARIESEALSAVEEWLAPLEHVGLSQERRALVELPRDLVGQRAGEVAQLSFGLGAGQYATSVLRELGDFSAPVAESPLT